MNSANNFFESLDDDQLGFYYAHEHDDDLEELLQDQLNIKQFNLYKQWKENKNATNLDFSLFSTLMAKLDNLTAKFDSLSQRIDKLETSHDAKSLDPAPLADSEVTNKWMLKQIKQINDKNLPKESKKVFSSTGNIEDFLSMKNQFEDYEEENHTVGRIIRTLMGEHPSSRPNIDSLNFYRERFVKNWKERDHTDKMFTNLLSIFSSVAGNPDDLEQLRTDAFLELFLLPSSAPEFSNLNIIAGELLFILLTVYQDNWNMKMSKKEVHTALKSDMKRWELGKLNSLRLADIDWVMVIQHYAKSETDKRYSSWMIANNLMCNSITYAKWLKEQGYLPVIEDIISNPSTDSEVKRLLQIALDILKN